MTGTPSRVGDKAASGPKLSASEYHGVSDFVKASLLKAKVFTDVALPIKNPNQQYYKAPVKVFATKKQHLDTVIDNLKALKVYEVKTVEKATPKIIKLGVTWLPKVSDATLTGIDNGSVADTQSFPVELHIFTSKYHLEVFRREKIDQELWKLIGSIISKPYGLTLKNDALYVRVEDAEKGHKDERYKSISSIEVTDNVKSILEFLGMDFDFYDDVESFKEWDDLMDFAVKCRFYNPAQLKASADAAISEKTSTKAPKEVHERSKNTTASAETVIEKISMKNADEMTLFEFWTEVYLARADAEVSKDHSFTREKVLEAAKAHFPDFAARFEQEKKQAIRQKNEIKMWNDLHTAVIPEFVKDPASRKTAVKGLKKAIREGEEAGFFIDKDLSFKFPDGMAGMKQDFDNAIEQTDFDAIIEAAKQHWFTAMAAQK